MNNKFHAISMCTLIAAFATSSWAVTDCPSNFIAGEDEEFGVAGECYYHMPEGGTETLTIPAGLKSFKLVYWDGDGDFTGTLQLQCESGLNTVSVKGSADLAGGGTLEIFNRANLDHFGITQAQLAGFSYLSGITITAEDLQPTTPMFTCSNKNCTGDNSIPKMTGLNALKVTYQSTSGDVKSFQLEVTQEPYDFGPMQVIHTEGFKEVIQGDKTGFLQPALKAKLGIDITTIPDKVKNVLLLRGDAVKEEDALKSKFTGVPSAVDVDLVYLNREFAVNGSGLYSTLTLPFNISKANITNVSNVYEFKNVEGNKAHFTSADKLDAYTPYLIELVDKATGIEFSNGVTLESSEDVSTDVRKDNWVFRGTLNYKKWDESNDADKAVLEGCGTSSNPKSCAYGYAASGTYQGQFVRIGNGAYIFPFRAYLVYEEPKATKLAPANASYVLRPTVDIPDELELVVDGKDGQTTSIGRFDTRTGEIHINNMKHTYDLKGRRVNGTNNARGAYYGKKVLMK